MISSSMWDYQKQVGRWCRDLFGSNVAKDVRIRNFRFLEEALELVQSLGCTKDEALQLADYVYSRPIGVPFQEVGGTAVTLAALCEASDIDFERAAWTEQSRCEQPEVKAKIKAKQASKIGTSALPGGGEDRLVLVRGEKYEYWSVANRREIPCTFIGVHPHDGACLILEELDREDGEIAHFFIAERGDLRKP